MTILLTLTPLLKVSIESTSKIIHQKMKKFWQRKYQERKDASKRILATKA